MDRSLRLPHRQTNPQWDTSSKGFSALWQLISPYPPCLGLIAGALDFVFLQRKSWATDTLGRFLSSIRKLPPSVSLVISQSMSVDCFRPIARTVITLEEHSWSNVETTLSPNQCRSILFIDHISTQNSSRKWHHEHQRGKFAWKSSPSDLSLLDWTSDDGPDTLAALFRDANKKVAVYFHIVHGRFVVLHLKLGHDFGECEIEFGIGET